ncbi:MAG: hypothetical protein C5S45_01615, partial [Candidatus Methanocomedens sp.]
MEKKSTTRKNKTLLTQLTWLGVLTVSVVLFATCFEWTISDQEGYTNSSFDVPVVIKAFETGDFARDLNKVGSFGIMLPEGWTVNDSIGYSSKGVTHNEPVAPYDSTGWVIYDADRAQMYEDSAVVDYEARTNDNPNGWIEGENIINYDTPDGYYWWGGVTSSSVRLDNLDSISLTVTINTDDQTGEFELQFAMGGPYGGWWPRNPVLEGGVSELVSVTITESTSVEEYLQREISVYPNPAADMLNINVGGIREGEIQIIDITGKVHMERTLTSKV